MKSTSLFSRRGSALVTVLLFSAALSIIIASVLRYSLTERRLNYRAAMRLEARNAAEAISEYGLAQVRQKLETRSDFSPTRFTTGADANAIALPANSFWAGSRVVTTTGTATSPELEIGLLNPVVNGTTSANNTLFYYDPADPSNEFDPLKGRYAFRFDVRVISRATVNPPTAAAGGQQTVYMSQTLSVRAAPLFSHAIFYNMDLELWPGPTMNLLGGVHTNGNLYVKKQSSNGSALNFLGPVTVAGGGHPQFTSTGARWDSGFYSGIKWAIANTNGTSDDLSSYTDNTFFSTTAGGLSGIKQGSGGSTLWRDQKWGNATETATTQETFRVWATQTFGGNLQTNLHGILVSNLTGVGDYVEDPTPTNGVDNSINEARQLILPPLLSSDAGYDAEVEKLKYSTRAGLYIAVNPTGTTRTARKPNGSTFQLPAGGYRVFTVSGTELVLPGQPFFGTPTLLLPNGQPNALANASGEPIITVRTNAMTDLRRGRTTNGALHNWMASRSATNNYSPLVIDTIDLDMRELKCAVDRSVNGLTQSTVYNTTTPANGTSTSSTNWTRFIYNPNATPAAVTLDNTNKILVPNPLLPLVSTDWNGGEWNGAIYIQSVDAEARSATYTAAGRDLASGVRIINGRGRIASRTNGQGLTIATNDAVYVLGHLNADGTINTATTGTTNSGRYNETDEVPLSIVGDALTILSMPGYTNNGTAIGQSMGWNDARSGHTTNASSSYSTSWMTSDPSNSNRTEGVNTTVFGYRCPYSKNMPYNESGSAQLLTVDSNNEKEPGNNTEISAAFLVGIVPSNKDGNGQNSGGANNYPRMLEDFSRSGTQSTIAIRGSLVAMYESRVATEPWNWRTFNAPIRLWGFNELFNTGRFPPLTPVTMYYRRIDFNDIPASQYNALKTAWGS